MKKFIFSKVTGLRNFFTGFFNRIFVQISEHLFCRIPLQGCFCLPKNKSYFSKIHQNFTNKSIPKKNKITFSKPMTTLMVHKAIRFMVCVLSQHFDDFTIKFKTFRLFKTDVNNSIPR